MFLKLEFNFEKHLVRLFLSFFLFFFFEGRVEIGTGMVGFMCGEKNKRTRGKNLRGKDKKKLEP